MATYVKINETLYPASIEHELSDLNWNHREVKNIHLQMSHFDAVNLFVNDAAWSIVEKVFVPHEDGDEYLETNEIDCKEYCVAGPIIDHRDGTLTIKMGKHIAEELLAMLEEVL